MDHPQVAQAKKEAKRLLSIAKKSNPDTPTVQIKSLTDAKNIVAYMNGYRSWNEFQKIVSAEIKQVTHEFVVNAPYSPVEFYCHKDIEISFISKWLKTRRYPVETKLAGKRDVHPDLKKFNMGSFDRKNGFFGPKKTNDMVMSDSQMRCHIAVSGDVSHGARNFLLRLAKIQSNRGAPLIYFAEGDDTAIPSKLFAMNQNGFIGIGETNSCHWLQMSEKRNIVSDSVYSVDPFEDISGETLARMLLCNFGPNYIPDHEEFVPLLHDVLSGMFDLRSKAGMIITPEIILEALTIHGMIFLSQNKMVSTLIREALSVHLSIMSCHISNGYTNISLSIDETLRSVREAIKVNLQYISEGYSVGYFSSTPTDSIRSAIEENISLCISTPANKNGLTKFNKTLMVEKILNFMSKQMGGRAHRNRDTALIVFDQSFSSDESIGLNDRFSTAVAMARAFGYSLVFANNDGRFSQRIEANTATKVIFGKTGNFLASHLYDKVEQWSHGFEDFSGKADVRELKEGDFIHIFGGKVDLVHLPFESLSEIAFSIPKPELRYAEVEMPGLHTE